MILEVAILNVIPGREAQFETAFRKAQAIISSMNFLTAFGQFELLRNGFIRKSEIFIC